MELVEASQVSCSCFPDIAHKTMLTDSYGKVTPVRSPSGPASPSSVSTPSAPPRPVPRRSCQATFPTWPSSLRHSPTCC